MNQNYACFVVINRHLYNESFKLYFTK